MKAICLSLTGLVFFSILLSGNNLCQGPPTPRDTVTFIEKLYLHTDRDNYFPGDDIWFKAYLVNSSDRFLTDHSRNLHVELISPDSRIIDSRIVRLDKGLGHGDFHLSGKLPSGKYRLRAYTNYMRNYVEPIFFKKDFNIINSSDALKIFSDSVSYTVTRPDITFYPEGGSLVDNVPSTVAFKAVDQHDRSLDVSGEIVTTEGDSVTGFKSTHNGMGTFMLQPLPDKNYYALIKNSQGDTLKYKLPEAFSTGIVMNVAHNANHKLSVIFRTNTLTLPHLKENDLNIKISARGNPFKEYNFRMNSLNSLLTLPTDDLPDGIIMLTLTGIDNIPLCERLVFISSDDNASVNIETDRSDYKLRDSIKIRLSLSMDSKTSHGAYISMSATNDLFMNDPDSYSSDIASWILLESDVRGKIEEPAYYFDPSNTGRLKDLDLLLLTQGWRDFRWKYNGLEYPPEYGFSVSGSVRKRLSDAPVENATVTIGFLNDRKPLIDYLPTDSTGHFVFEDIDFSGNATIIATITDDQDKMTGWLLLDSSKYASPGISESGNRTNYIRVADRRPGGISLPAYIQYSDFKTSLSRKYKLSDTIRPGEVSITAKRQTSVEKARAESQHFLRSVWVDQEYEVTPISKTYVNVGRLLTERFQIKPPGQIGAGLSGQDNRVQNISSASTEDINSKMAALLNPRQGSSVRIDPIILLDGNEVGWDGVESIPIDWIARVDYVKGRNAQFIWGIRGTGGVISVVLKPDLLNNNTSVVYHSAKMKFNGFSEARIFYSPKHNTTLNSDYKPDLRNTLFWDPDVILREHKDTTLVFYNSDNPGTVLIKAEGITDKGIPVTGSTVYRVVR